MIDRQRYQKILDEIKDAGLWKEERVITTQQSALIDTTKAKGVLNFCANNYLGLANNPELMKAARDSYAKYGYGMSSVRFICGTQTVHKELEHALSEFLGTEDTILYSSCFDANGGLFETITTEKDAIISDALNHASIIDGVRLAKANTVTPTTTWQTLKRSLKKPTRKARSRKSSSQTACFPWTA